MQHADIESQNLVDRYLMGRMNEREAERFEEHYLHCQACLDQLEAADLLQRGLKQMGAEAFAPPQVAGRPRRAAGLPALGLAAAAVLALALVPAGMLRQQLKVARADLSAAHQRAEQLAAEGEAARAEAGEAEGLRRALQAEQIRSQEIDSERQSLRQQLERLENAPRTAPRGPRTAFHIYRLSPERSGAVTAPSLRLRPGGQGWVEILRLDLDPPIYPDYRISLRDAAGKEVLSVSGQVDAEDSLRLGLPSEMLTAGDYTLEVEGLEDGKASPAGRFRFRVEP